MRGTSKGWKRALRWADEGMDALAMEFAGAILDLVDYVEPMVKDGRIKTMHDLGLRVTPILNSNGLLSAIFHKSPWTFPAFIAHSKLPHRKKMLRLWHREVQKERLPRKAAQAAGRAVIVWALMDALAQQGFPGFAEQFRALTDEGPKEPPDPQA